MKLKKKSYILFLIILLLSNPLFSQTISKSPDATPIGLYNDISQISYFKNSILLNGRFYVGTFPIYELNNGELVHDTRNVFLEWKGFEYNFPFLGRPSAYWVELQVGMLSSVRIFGSSYALAEIFKSGISLSTVLGGLTASYTYGWNGGDWHGFEGAFTGSTFFQFFLPTINAKYKFEVQNYGVADPLFYHHYEAELCKAFQYSTVSLGYRRTTIIEKRGEGREREGKAVYLNVNVNPVTILKSFKYKVNKKRKPVGNTNRAWI